MLEQLRNTGRESNNMIYIKSSDTQGGGTMPRVKKSGLPKVKVQLYLTPDELGLIGQKVLVKVVVLIVLCYAF